MVPRVGDHQHTVRGPGHRLGLFERLGNAALLDISLLCLFKDSTWWIRLRREVRSFLVGYLKTAEGELSEFPLNPQTERERMIECMTKDGLSPEEIEETLGTLSPEELQLLSQALDDVTKE